jgi:hypothetical protein
MTKIFLFLAPLLLLACASGRAIDPDLPDQSEPDAGAPEAAAEQGLTWCCEVRAADGNARFSRFCGISEADAVSWMRNPDEVCWDDAL